MPAFTPIRLSRWPAALAGALLALATAHSGRALEIAGNYADKGTQAPTSAAEAPAVVSLHGLLSLVFDPALARARFSDTSRIEFLPAGSSTIEARIRDESGAPHGLGRWTLGRDCARDGRKLVLHLRGPDSGDDWHVLVLERTDDDRLLQVTVTHAAASAFGPGTRKVGTYFFPRLP